MHQRKAFTLIELLVVISIIAILAVIVFTQVQGLTGRARNTTSQTTVREAGNAINVFRNTEGTADGVIRNANATTAADLTLSATTGDTPWGGIFSGTVGVTATAATYPTRIVRVSTANNVLTYRVLNSSGTNITGSGSATNTAVVNPAPGCVIVASVLSGVGTNTDPDVSFYRNGIISSFDSANTATTGTVTAANLTCTAP